MKLRGFRATLVLFLGDLLVFAISLWLMLVVRYLSVPEVGRLTEHFISFAPLFFLWVGVFYVAGLYGKRVILFKTAVLGVILRTQILNIVLAALYFFIATGVSIAPKTNLFLYLLISLVLIIVWRFTLYPNVSRPLSRERAALIGSGPELTELADEVNKNARYHLEFVVVASAEEITNNYHAFKERLKSEEVELLVIDADQDPLQSLLPHLYELAFISPGYQILDFHAVYEEVFDRVPLSLISHDWFIKNVSVTESSFYPFAKRVIDIVGGILLGIGTVVATPFVALALLLEGDGPVFISQKRIGKFGAIITVYKFRSMRYNDGGKWHKGSQENYVTKVGSFLRKISLDEFPQFINILKGELSLIGPRNDMRDLGEQLGSHIPYYNVRYLVVPGITGWAQINQQYEKGNISPQSLEETRMRLAYDFYYIKKRSLALDLVIASKTIKRMLFRS